MQNTPLQVQEQLDEAKRVAVEMQRHMDRIAGLLNTAYDNPTPANMRLLTEASRAMNREAYSLNSKLVRIKEKQPMKRTVLMLVLSLALLVFVSSFAVAQDNPPLATNTQIVEGTATLISSEPLPTVVPEPAATESPAPIIDEAPTSGNNNLIELFKVAIPWLGAIGIVGLIVIGILGRESLVRLGKSAPVAVREPIFSGVETGVNKLVDYTHTTITPIDDAAADELKKFVLGVIAEVRADEQARTGNAVASAPDPLTGAWHAQYPGDMPPSSG